MRLCFMTFGSEGDTRLLTALCRELLDQGHELKLFAEHSTLTLPRSLGIDCEALLGDVKATLPIESPHNELRLSQVLKTIQAMNAVIKANTAAWLRTIAPYARDADAILFSSLAASAGNTLRQALNKPGIGLFFQPLTPTREFSSPMLPPLPLPGWANKLTFRSAHRQIWQICGKPAQAARLEVFGIGTGARLRVDHPVLYCISKELVVQPADWPSAHRICGHWSIAADTWQAPVDLLNFLEAGERPIYIGFGSPSAFIRKKALTALIDAIDGRRAIFSPGWSQIDETVLPENFFVARDVPHEWLFPRVSMVIHHGGAGTTHTAARAGVPQIVLAIGADHFFWAHRVALRGVAPKYSRNDRFNSKAIRRMIDFAQRDVTQQNAEKLGEAMSRENGVAEAIREIKNIVATAKQR